MTSPWPAGNCARCSSAIRRSRWSVKRAAARKRGARSASSSPELLLLDVRMPQGDGFSVLEDLDRPPYVIFATAHAEHAVHAFDVAAVDYLLKPFDDERFERSIQRAKDAIRTQKAHACWRRRSSHGMASAPAEHHRRRRSASPCTTASA